MKTIKFAIAAALFGSAFSVAPAMADPDKYAGGIQGKEAVDFCRAFSEAIPVYSFGDCMSIIRSGGAPGFCKEIDLRGWLDLFGYKNVGECVKTLRQL